MSAFAELESDMISERTRDVLKKTNKHKINRKTKRRVIKLNDGGVSKTKIAENVGISLGNIYNIINSFPK